MQPLPIRKICFIEPKSPGNHVYSRWGMPRLGTLILGSLLRQAGYEVSVFIEGIKGIDFEEVFDADLVGISTITSTAPRAYELANSIRKAGIPVFMGGPHVSFLQEEALTHCDYVMCGECEGTILPFVQALRDGSGMEKIPGLAWREAGAIRQNPWAEHVCNLDVLPFPDFGLIRGKEKFKGDLSVTPIMTSRGCPFGCNFCAVTAMFGRRYRFRSVENVISELKALKPEWVFFYDDNFAARPEHTRELLQRMIDEGIRCKWSAQVRIDVAKDPELLKLMKRAGCIRFYIGLESTNPKTLAAMNKGQTPEQIEEAIRIIHDHGINIHGMFIFGADQDDPSTIRATVKFAKKNDISSVQFMILTPLPGTEVFNRMAEEGRLLSRDWGYYDAHHVVFTPKKMSVLQLQTLTIKSMVKFYTLPRALARLNRFDIWTMLIRAYGWRLVRQTRRNMKWFVEYLREVYQHAGEGIAHAREELTSARAGFELKARRTTDDLREKLRGVNFDRIRELKQERIRQWRESLGQKNAPGHKA